MKSSILSTLLLILALATVLSATAVPNLREYINSHPPAWRQLGPAHPTDRLSLIIGLRQSNLDLLESTLLAVSDPTNTESYGRHLTNEEIHSMVAPSDSAISAVRSWIQSYGVSQCEANLNSDMIRCEVEVAVAERLLNAKYHVYQHEGSERTVIRALQYAIPEEVAKYIDVIGPTHRFPQIQNLKLSSAAASSVDPTFIRNLYNIGATVSTSSQNSQSVTGFLEQYISDSDLEKFEQKYASWIEGQEATIVGPNNQTEPGIEASLDIQYVMAIGSGVPSTFWSTAGRQPGNNENEPFLEFLYNVGNTTNPPFVFSISYGDNEDTVDFDYAVRVGVEFQKGGLRGITFLASSGDGGVSGSQNGFCTTFIPTFPAGSPWITAVGATHQSAPEVAASFSTGGFSNYFVPNSFQTSAIQTYFKTASNLPPTSKFNASGNGIPDVSAQGVDFLIVISGFSTGVSGTSCSSPTFAGVVSLLNDIRLKAGKTTLGYLNQLFYTNPSVFNDITKGNNPGCSTQGFEAAAGWDPITGLGTPDFTKLSALVSSLP